MDVKRFYSEINGSYQSALSIMMNDILIARMLAKFMENNVYKDIIAAYEAKNYRELFSLTHTFKGVTGNLALTPLYELSSYLTEATRNSDNVNLDKEIADLTEKYNLVVKSYKECQ